MKTKILSMKDLKGSFLKEYLYLRARGYTRLWAGEGKICMQAPEAVKTKAVGK